MKKHKLLAVLLALVMTLSLLPTAALAEELAALADGPSFAAAEVNLSASLADLKTILI